MHKIKTLEKSWDIWRITSFKILFNSMKAFYCMVLNYASPNLSMTRLWLDYMFQLMHNIVFFKLRSKQ